MSEYEAKTSIHSSPDKVFRFLSSVHTIQRYLPWIREIRQEHDDYVFAVVEEAGSRREFGGFFRVSHETRRIDWGSDGMPEYRGWLEVNEAAGGTSDLTVHLSLEGPHNESIRQTLENTLNSIRKMAEKQGSIIAEERRVA